MEIAKIRILVVDDYEPFRRFISSTASSQPKWQVIGEVSDGLQAVQRAEELQPDLILLDIGLPKLNGIEAARRIKKFCPTCKVVFVSENRFPEVAEAALSTGAGGYVVKSFAATELLPAVAAVLDGKQFISDGLSPKVFVENSHARTSEAAIRDSTVSGSAPGLHCENRHVVQFYADDSELLDSLTTLFRNSLNAGESAIAILTRAHRITFEERLIAEGIDVNGAIKEGRLTIVDSHERLSQFMDADGLNRERFRLQFGNMIDRAQAAALGEDKKLVVFGEMVGVLCARDRYDTAIWLEDLWNELALTRSFYLCCAYPESAFREKSRDEHYASICAQHSEVVSAF